MISDIQSFIDNMTPDMYKQLKQSVELGKWPNGDRLTKEQSGLCLQGVIAYEQRHLQPEHRTGYIPSKKHTHCGSTKGNVADDIEQPLILPER